VRVDDSSPSSDYTPVDALEPFAAPLPDAPDDIEHFEFSTGPLHDVRSFVSRAAERLGLDNPRRADLVLAVNEMATNSVQHGGGVGRLRVWRDHGTLVCEITDTGVISEPLLGRRSPSVDGENGRGHWMANQVCDLVQLHSSRAGTAVRLHMRLA
jgi:anti-sigma regulatory factor (Ser/Thr protein kinase)